MKDFTELKKNLKKDFTGFKHIKIALLADSSIQLLAIAIKSWGIEYALHLELFEADIDQIDRQIMDYSSELYSFNPDTIIIFESAQKFLKLFNKLTNELKNEFADKQLLHLDILQQTISQQLQPNIIYVNQAELDDVVYGNYGNKVSHSFITQQRKFNYLLMEKARSVPHLHISDLSTIQNRYGKMQLFSTSQYIASAMIIHVEMLPVVARSMVDIINSLYGNFKKCIILDLDNTLWGGIIGDDGLENIQIGNLGIGKAFTEFQYWLQSLQQRGIILAICSKNDEVIAKEPFEKHPDMILKLEDFAVFNANWNNKADSIKEIQSILHIGFDSMVFIDDNPFERNIVRQNIQGICVPEMPKDPADYLDYLYSLNLFETISSSTEDNVRTTRYQIEALREQVHQKFINEDEYLKSLNMKSLVESFNAFNTPRVAQLSQRSNQWNLRTVRYTEADIKRLASSKEYFTFAFTLVDNYGDNGLICVVILNIRDSANLFIENWFMSCRVLKRGMESFVLNTIVNFAKEQGFKFLQAEYIPSSKNNMVKDHYNNLGFSKSDNYEYLDLTKFINKHCFITEINYEKS